jgi:hypothetical protein
MSTCASHCAVTKGELIMKKSNLIGKQLNQYKRSGYWSKGVALGLSVTALASVFVIEPAWAIVCCRDQSHGVWSPL